MTVKELEQRVVALEREVKQLKDERGAASNNGFPDWRRALEKCRGDEDILVVIREGMKLREKERRAVQKKRSSSRQSLPRGSRHIGRPKSIANQKGPVRGAK
jgi:hypothetical protein